MVGGAGQSIGQIKMGELGGAQQLDVELAAKASFSTESSIQSATSIPSVAES